MIAYETVAVSGRADGGASVFNFSTQESSLVGGSLEEVVNDYNMRGFYVSAVDGRRFFLTRRID